MAGITATPHKHARTFTLRNYLMIGRESVYKGLDDSLSRARYFQDVNSNGAKWCNAGLLGGWGGGCPFQDTAIMSTRLPTGIWDLIS